MKGLSLTVLSLMLMSGAAYAQPHDDHHPHGGQPPAAHSAPPHSAMMGNAHPAPNNHPAPANRMMMGGPARSGPMGHVQMARGHHLPPGIRAPGVRHGAPLWRGRSWAVGDLFILDGFTGPLIDDWGGYDLPPPRRGTHWIYVDGYYLMIGNRTGRIFAEIPADY